MCRFLGNKAHMTLGRGVNGGVKWKHMVRISETIVCQNKDTNGGANLFKFHEDSGGDENWRNMDSYG